MERRCHHCGQAHRYWLLDLFCGAGGAAMGYHRAGFGVVGVDIAPQPRYPFEFHQGDVLTAYGGISGWAEYLGGFDAIHASPPCQAYSATRTIWNSTGRHPDLVGPVREGLAASGVLWVMENVPGAPLSPHIILCGTMFGLTHEEWELRRHRLFEVSGFWCMTPPCQHGGPVLGVYGGHTRDRRRTLGVYGHGSARHNADKGYSASKAEAQAIMGIDWMTMEEISQAIPPAYTEYVGARLMEHLGASRQPVPLT